MAESERDRSGQPPVLTHWVELQAALMYCIDTHVERGAGYRYRYATSTRRDVNQSDDVNGLGYSNGLSRLQPVLPYRRLDRRPVGDLSLSMQWHAHYRYAAWGPVGATPKATASYGRG